MVITARKRSLDQVLFSQASVILFTGGSQCRGVSVQGVSFHWDGLCLGGSLCAGGLCAGRLVSVQGSLCPGGALSRGVSVRGAVSVQGVSVHGVSVTETLSHVSGRAGSMHPTGVRSCLISGMYNMYNRW